MSLILYNYQTLFFTILPIASNTCQIFFSAPLLGFFDEIFTSKQPFGIWMVLSHPLFVTNTTPQLMIAMMCIYVTRGDAKSGR